MTVPRPAAFLLFVLTLLTVFAIGLTSMTHFDFWWYLKSGEHIVQMRSIPDTDPFSFTARGRPWINHMWLTQVILYGLWETVGRVPILVGKGILVAATFGVVLATCLRRGVHPILAAGVTVLAAVAGQGYWHVRPQLITYLGLAIYLYLLREGWEGRRRSLAWIPLLMIPWANLHAGFVAGLGLLGLIAAGEGVARLLRPESRAWRSWALLVGVVALAGAASLLNPFGMRALVFPVEVVSSRTFMTTTIEWFAPNFHDPQYRPLEAMILLLFAGMSLAGRLRVTDVLLAATFTHLGWSSIRHIPLFAVCVTPILATALSQAIERVWSWRGARLRRALDGMRAQLPSIWPLVASPTAHALAGAVLLAALLLGHATRALEPRFGTLAQDLNEQRYPIRTAEFMKRERVPGPLFNVYVWGGYVLWALYPDYQVFFDGRTHVYGEGVVRDYLDVSMLHPRWAAVLDRWGIQSVLTYPNYPLTQALHASTEWRLVFVDREAVLFVRNRPEHQALFDRIGPVARPSPPSAVQTALGAGVRAAERGEEARAIRAFEEALALDPDNPVALFSLGLVHDRRGDRRAAERLWRRLERTAPGSELARRAADELGKRSGPRR